MDPVTPTELVVTAVEVVVDDLKDGDSRSPIFRMDAAGRYDNSIPCLVWPLPFFLLLAPLAGSSYHDVAPLMCRKGWLNSSRCGDFKSAVGEPVSIHSRSSIMSASSHCRTALLGVREADGHTSGQTVTSHWQRGSCLRFLMALTRRSCNLSLPANWLWSLLPVPLVVLARLVGILQDLKDFARTAGSVHYAEVSRQDASEG